MSRVVATLLLLLMLALAISACEEAASEPSLQTAATFTPVSPPISEEEHIVTEALEGSPLFAFDKVQNVQWLWTERNEAEVGRRNKVRDPQQYTLTFLANGTASIKAGCNPFVSWTYDVRGEFLTFHNQELSDLANCGQDSLYQEYLAGLSRTISWTMEEQKLVLELAGGEGRLGFRDSGAVDEGAGPGAGTIAPIIFLWTGLSLSEPATEMVIDEPEKYTVTFYQDGHLEFTADCNSGIGSFKVAGANISIDGLGSPDNFCKEGSLSQSFQDLLLRVDTVEQTNQQATLILQNGAGEMRFDLGGLAAEPGE